MLSNDLIGSQKYNAILFCGFKDVGLERLIRFK